MSECKGQCHGCAFKAGAAANAEPDNLFRGALTALGGVRFYCHESLGWTEHQDGYKKETLTDLGLLLALPAIRAAGGRAASVIDQTEAVRKDLRVCAGWKAAVRRLYDAGWFRNEQLRHIRRQFAIDGLKVLDKITDPAGPPGEMFSSFEEVIDWFTREAIEQKIDIAWLFEGPALTSSARAAEIAP